MTNNVIGDYSCGNCGWFGYVENCFLELENENKPEGDGVFLCPECYSERIGEITKEDFKKGNKLFGKTWNKS